MRGQISAEFSIDTEPERALHERRRQLRVERLTASSAGPSIINQETEDEVSVHSEHSDSEPDREMAENHGDIAGAQPPAERLLGDYGGPNAQPNRMTIVNQPVTVAHFQLHPSTIRQLESKPFAGRINEDANKHLQRFLTTTTSLKIEGNSEEAKRLVMFPFTLSEDAEEWF